MAQLRLLILHDDLVTESMLIGFPYDLTFSGTLNDKCRLPFWRAGCGSREVYIVSLYWRQHVLIRGLAGCGDLVEGDERRLVGSWLGFLSHL